MILVLIRVPADCIAAVRIDIDQISGVALGGDMVIDLPSQAFRYAAGEGLFPLAQGPIGIKELSAID